MAAEFLERMGARIRARREELGLSRADVTRKMPGKVSENQLYRWENGKHNPNPDTLEAIAAALDCDVAYLLTDPPDDDARTPSLTDALREPDDDLRSIVSGLDEQVRLLRAELATRDAEVLRRIEEVQSSIQGIRRPPR